MNAVALTDHANKHDAGNFNANLFQYILFIANKADTDTIWSEANGKLKAWMKKQNKLKFQSMTQSTTQTSNRIKVLNHVNFLWKTPQQVKWSMQYEELV